MKLDPESGVIEFTSKIVLRPGMTRDDILSIDTNWQEWNVIKNIPRAFRSIINLPNQGISPKTILIVYVGLEERPLAFWDVAPWDMAEGTQNRPEGKYNKRMRAWFETMFCTKLPLKKNWGHIDASFDAWNQSGGIICNYRERFDSDERWERYKKNNNY
jgi:hypothetical protein